ncbi:MAG: hypothetical protein IPM32_17010 [Ignavibacteriae bacterium]|nr:hypothetical protein [Ignavibacteriota bacterium]
MVLDKKQIENKITEYLKNRDEVVIAYIFGSFVNKELYHDIDVAVYLVDNFDKNDFKKFPYGYESEFISNLTILTKKGIDFVVMNNAEITIQQRIVNNGICLFSKDETKRIYYENYIRKLYIDSENIRRIKRRYLKRRIANA